MHTRTVQTLAIVTAMSMSRAASADGACGRTALTSSMVQPGAETGVRELLRRAVERSPRLAAARADVEKARGRRVQAGLLANPTLDLEQVGGRALGSANEQERTVTLGIPVDYAGRRAARVAKAEAELRAARAEYENELRTFVASVRKSYGEAVAARRELEGLGALGLIDDGLRRLMEARVEQGDAPPLELELLRAESDRLRARSVRAEGRATAALAELQGLAGTDPSEPLRLQDELLEFVPRSLPSTLAEAVEQALVRRADVAAARFNVEAARAQLRLARREGFPDLTASGLFRTNRQSFQGDTTQLVDDQQAFGIALSLTLPLFNRNQGAIVETAADVERAQHLEAAAELRVRTEVTSAFLRLRATERAVTLLRDGVVGRSLRNVETLRAAYEAGGVAFSEVLAGRRTAAEAQKDLAEAVTERFSAAAELDAALGMPVDGE